MNTRNTPGRESWPPDAVELKNCYVLKTGSILYSYDFILRGWRKMRVYNVSGETVLLQGMEGALCGVLWTETFYNLENSNYYLLCHGK